MKFHYSEVLLIFIISAYGIIPYKRRNVTAPQLNLSLRICDLRSTFRKKKVLPKCFSVWMTKEEAERDLHMPSER